jgi:thioredoxin reductase
MVGVRGRRTGGALDEEERLDWDAIVVGGGPAGLAAATWLARYRRRTLVLDAEEPRNRWVEQAHGYLGSDPGDPAELRQRALDDLDRYPSVERRCTSVLSAEAAAGDLFVVQTEEGPETARRLVLATGVADVFPDVGGFFTHYGADVFHCPTCDGYEAGERRVVVFGWTAEVAGFALNLLDWAAALTVVTNGQQFEGDQDHRAALDRNGVRLLTDEAVELVGERGALEGVRLRDGDLLQCDMAFFTIAHEPIGGLAAQLGCRRDAEGYVVVDHEARTSVPGVFAAGDLTPGMQLLQVAAAKGAVAGVTCALSLRGQPASSASEVPDPEAEIGDG